ncbi:MAG TPA: hypothetical protein PKD49_09960 [Hyphomicrobium sp.]|nr:hypothetical protein [Hyphomicrobium sp.]
MLGQIKSFHRDIGVGIIDAEDGRKYRFMRRDIVNQRAQLAGVEVDFDLDGRSPRQIIVLAGSPWSVFAAPLVQAPFTAACEVCPSFAPRLAA